jgi:hypothetical protein
MRSAILSVVLLSSITLSLVDAHVHEDSTSDACDLAAIVSQAQGQLQSPHALQGIQLLVQRLKGIPAFNHDSEWQCSNAAGCEDAPSSSTCPKLSKFDRVMLLSTIRDAYSAIHMHEQAVQYGERIVKLCRKDLKTSAPSSEFRDAILSLASLAWAYRMNMQFEPAEALIEEIRTAISAIKLPQQSSVDIESTLLRLESALMECQGDDLVALLKFEQALRMSKQTDSSSALQHIDLVKSVLAKSDIDIPPVVRHQMEQRLASLHKQVKEKVGYARNDQLPEHYVAGLQSQPWYDFKDSNPVIRNARKYIIDSQASLKKEYHLLADADLLQQERECILAPGKGNWTRFEVTGRWQELDDNACARHSPVACSVVKHLKDIGLPVIRAGYSALKAKTWLKPHFGHTNAQLKFHLGLIVPRDSDTGGPCAIFRVGDELRTWSERDVLYFDDSFEHEVWNSCNETRVVFQIVFRHHDTLESQQSPSSVVFS